MNEYQIRTRGLHVDVEVVHDYGILDRVVIGVEQGRCGESGYVWVGCLAQPENLLHITNKKKKVVVSGDIHFRLKVSYLHQIQIRWDCIIEAKEIGHRDEVVIPKLLNIVLQPGQLDHCIYDERERLCE